MENRPVNMPFPHACFTYGSLMCEDIFAAVSGMTLRPHPARLSGFSRHPVIGTDYPGIRHNDEASVPGQLYFGVSALALERLDRFEGDEYQREEVAVTLDDGRTEDAWVYVFDPRQHHRLDAGAWDFDRFLRHGKARFLRRHPPAPI